MMVYLDFEKPIAALEARILELQDAARDSDKIRQIPIAPLLGEAIKRIADESSVSSLFD